MPNLYCKENCSNHKVELFDSELKKLQEIFDDIDYQFESIKYDESTENIVITLVGAK